MSIRNKLAPLKGVWVFLAIVFLGSWLVDITLRPLVPFIFRAVLAMFLPALAAWLVRGPIFREGFDDAGIRPHLPESWNIYVAAYLSIPLLICAGLFFSTATGLQHWGLQSVNHILDASSFSSSGIRKIPANTMVPIPLVIVGIVASLSVAIPTNMIVTFGEEFGWRGYLLPRLMKFGRLRAALLVGVIWGLWHTPMIVLDGYNYPGHPVAGVFMMIAFTIPLSIIFTWFRFASRSIWPCVLAHAAINAQAGIGLFVLSPANSLLRAPIGLLGLIPFWGFGGWIVATKRL